MNFREKIKSKGLKITWIAKQLEISQPMLSMHLSGDRPLKPEREKQLKDLLK